MSTTESSSIPSKNFKRVKIYHESHKENELYGSVYCMGTGDMGQLGLGTLLCRMSAPDQAYLIAVVAVVVEKAKTCLLSNIRPKFPICHGIAYKWKRAVCIRPV
jgi:hypothetical protein